MKAISFLTIPVILYSILFDGSFVTGAELDLNFGVPQEFHEHIVDGMKKIENLTKPQEFTNEHFSFTEVSFKPALKKYIEVNGEVHNISGKNFETARFTIKIYDANQQLLASRSFHVSNFNVGQGVKFNFYMPHFDYNKIKEHKIQFEEGYYF